MKKRRLFSTLAAALVTASMLAALPMNFGAAGTNYDTTTFATDSVNTTQLKKVLVIEDNANIPASTFKFTASAGELVNATDSTLAVLAGVGAENITYKLVTGANTTEDFDSGKTSKDDIQKTSSVILDYAAQEKVENDIQNDDYVTITDDDSKNTYSAVKTIQLDFSGCGFTEPGVYRYIITEEGTNSGITNDTNTKRTIDVYVEDATTTDTTSGTTTKKLKITGYVMYVGTQTAGPSNSQTVTQGTSFTAEDGTTNTTNGMEVSGATKSVGFKNTYSTHDLTFGKEVTGNQGSKDKYFKFTVNITDAVAGTIYNVDVSKADAKLPTTDTLNAATDSSYAEKTNPTSITVGADGTVSTDFYLQDGQSIVIKGIADGTAYTITETQEDYTPTAVITGDKLNSSSVDLAMTISADGKTASVADDGLTADTEVTFTNNRNGVIPTGILISVAPAAIIGICVIGGIVFLIAKNKRRESEED